MERNPLPAGLGGRDSDRVQGAGTQPAGRGRCSRGAQTPGPGLRRFRPAGRKEVGILPKDWTWNVRMGRNGEDDVRKRNQSWWC